MKKSIFTLSLIMSLALLSSFNPERVESPKEKVLIYRIGDRIIVSKEFLNLPKCEREAIIFNLK